MADGADTQSFSKSPFLSYKRSPDHLHQYSSQYQSETQYSYAHRDHDRRDTYQHSRLS